MQLHFYYTPQKTLYNFYPQFIDFLMVCFIMEISGGRAIIPPGSYHEECDNLERKIFTLYVRKIRH